MTAPEHISQLLPRFRTVRCVCGEEDINQRHLLGEWTPAKCRVCRAAERQSLDQLAGHAPPESPDVEREKRMRLLPTPPEFRDATLENIRPYGTSEDRDRLRKASALAKNFLAQWAKDPHTCTAIVIMRGGTGTAKTHTAWAIARDLVARHNSSVLFVKLADMVRELRASWGGGDGEAERQVLAKYRSPDLLVIDEVSQHAMYGIENVKQHLYDIVGHRAEWRKPTILTTNETVPDLMGLVLGDALASRVHGAGALWEFGSPKERTDYRVWSSERRRRDLE